MASPAQRRSARNYYLRNRQELLDKNRPRIRWWHIRRKYGLTRTQYEQMLAEQGGTCAICHNPETVKDRSGNLRLLAVDHDHEWGCVRALLCDKCNRGIAAFLDDIGLLRRAADYIKGYTQRPPGVGA